ncbi:ROK family transcriptional regulator [uncultured Hoeflea sp.]|uniref:ROK family transcriptional regulator n=1 Tax=uncultured Hoeflea sp. TaxID=538666 RepID=UPI0030D837AE
MTEGAPLPDMRFAPPNPLRIADRATGLNSVSVRSYNERLLLSLLLENESISRFEIGEKTGLSAQTVSVLVRSLEKEGLVSKGEALKERGRVGPPTVPISLNPEGAYSVGISMGYKHTEVVLIDFVGAVRFHSMLPNDGQSGKSNHPEFLQTINEAIRKLPEGAGGRLAGIGLAFPEAKRDKNLKTDDYQLRQQALQEEIESEIGIPVFVQNDITAAASGESMFGAAKPLSDYLFFYLGAELHSRLILNHQIYHGNSSLSFDVGIRRLETQLHGQDISTDALWDRSSQWPDYGETQKVWEAELVERIRLSFETLTQFVEMNTIVLSSYAPQDICQKICEQLESVAPGSKAMAGIINPSPKAIGAASLPFSSRFMVE